MKTVYYLPFNAQATSLLEGPTSQDIVNTINKFKETFLKGHEDIIVVPSFNGKEGFECMPETLNN